MKLKLALLAVVAGFSLAANAQTETRQEVKAEAKAANADLYMSLNRTCELGLTRATGKTYVHVLEELASRAAPVNA